MSFRTMFHADEENRTSDGKRQLYMCMYVLVNYDSCDIHLYIVPVTGIHVWGIKNVEKEAVLTIVIFFHRI